MPLSDTLAVITGRTPVNTVAVAAPNPQRTVEQQLDALTAMLDQSQAAMDPIIAATGVPSRAEIRDLARGIDRTCRAARRLIRMVRSDFAGV